MNRIVECGWNAKQALAELRGHQPYHASFFFHRYPAILREVEANRDDWLRDLAEMDDPPVLRPGQRKGAGFTSAGGTTELSLTPSGPLRASPGDKTQ